MFVMHKGSLLESRQVQQTERACSGMLCPMLPDGMGFRGIIFPFPFWARNVG